MSKSKGDAFAKAEPAPARDPLGDFRMNLRKWRDKGTARVVKYAEVFLAPGLQAEIDALDAEIVRLGTDNPESVPLAEQAEALREEMQSSRMSFKFAGIDSENIRSIADGFEKDADGNVKDNKGFTCQVLAAQCVEPKGMTADDFADLFDALGEGYFGRTLLAASGAARDGVSVDVPFSLAASLTLKTRESSAS